MEERAASLHLRIPHKNFSPLPVSPYSQQIPVSSSHSRSRSLSQPAAAFFSLDSLPPLSPCLPPRKPAHRRSNSDAPFGALPPLVPPKDLLDRQLVKNELHGMGERKSEDDFVSAYMDLDNMGGGVINSTPTTKHKNFHDDDSRASGTKATIATDNSSENEAESCIRCNLQFTGKREGAKRTAAGEDICPTTTSVSLDRLPTFGDDSPNPSACLQYANSLTSFSLDFGNGEFNAAELKKIMANDKLAEIALTDPKRVKRILANRQSAARSKERKVRYISELEHKVQTLQSEATTLSAQLTLLQRDSAGLNSQNNELKFRLQAMEQQAHLRDALNEALTAEVKRLKLATGESSAETQSSSLVKQLSKNFQLQHQQPTTSQHQQQILLQAQEQKQQNPSSVTKDESDPIP